MIELTTDRGRFISAALGLAAERPWDQVTLADIAERAGSNLAVLRANFPSKAAILAAFMRLVDDATLAQAPRRAEGQPKRDALFEIIMGRFDVLEPDKTALRSISQSGAPEPALICPVLKSQRWMLEGAGIGTDGVMGGIRTAGLASIYAPVFQTWLSDNDPGLARTMAALDRRMRNGEQTIRTIDGFCDGIGRVGSALRDLMCRRAAGATGPEPAPSAPTAAPGAPAA